MAESYSGNKRTPLETKSTQFNNSNDIDEFFRKFESNGFVDWYNKNHANKGYFKGKGKIRGEEWNKIWNNIETLFNKTPINLLEFFALNTIMLNESPTFEAESERVGRKGTTGLAYAFNRLPGIKRSYNTLGTNRTAYDNFNDPDYIKQFGNLKFANLYINTTDDRWKGEEFPPGGTSDEAGKNTNGGSRTFISECDFFKFRGRGFIQTTGRENYKPIIDFILNYKGVNNTIKSVRSKWTNIAGNNTDKIATISTNEDWDNLFQKSSGIIPNIAVWLHAKPYGYTNIPANSDDNTLKKKVRNVAFKIAGGGAKTYANTYEGRFYQQLNPLLGTEDNLEDEDVKPSEEQGDNTTENGNQSPTNETDDKYVESDQNDNLERDEFKDDSNSQKYPDDLPKVEGLKNFFRPKIDVKEIEFELDSDSDTQSEIASSMGYTPFVWYYGYQLQYLINFSVSSEGLVPKCKFTFIDNLGTLTDKVFPLDNSIFTVFLNSRTPSLRPIYAEFKMTHFSRSSDNTFRIEGLLNVDKLYIREFESYSQMSSFKCTQEWAKKAELGFNSNISESDDVMTWLNPGKRGMDFLKDVVKNSYRNDQAFIWIYIDLYYNLNYIDVEESLKIDIKNQIQVASTGVGRIKGFTNEKEKTSALLLTNDPAYEQSPNYFNKWKIINNSTVLSLMNGYLNKVKFYDTIDKNYSIFDIDSITSEGDKTIILKDSPQNMDFFQKNIRTTYIGTIDKDNMHFNYNYSTVQNQQNILDLQKIGISLTLNNPNYNLYRYQKVEVLISQATGTSAGTQYNNRLSGEWLIVSIEYILSDEGYKQKVNLIRRELSLSEEEIKAEPKQDKRNDLNDETETDNTVNTNDTGENEEVVENEEPVGATASNNEPEPEEEIEFSYDMTFNNVGEVEEYFNKINNDGYIGFYKDNIGGDINRTKWTKLWNSSEIIYGRKEFNIVEFLCLSTVLYYLNDTYDILIDNRELRSIYLNNNTYGNNEDAYYLFDDEDYLSVNGNGKWNGYILPDGTTINNDDSWDGILYPPIDEQSPSYNLPIKKEDEFITNSDFYKFRQRGYISLVGRSEYRGIVEDIKNYNNPTGVIEEYQNLWENDTNIDRILTKSTNKDWDKILNDDIGKFIALSYTFKNINNVNDIPTEGKPEDKIFNSIRNFSKLTVNSSPYYLRGDRNEDDLFITIKNQINVLQKKETIPLNKETSIGKGSESSVSDTASVALGMLKLFGVKFANDKNLPLSEVSIAKAILTETKDKGSKVDYSNVSKKAQGISETFYTQAIDLRNSDPEKYKEFLEIGKSESGKYTYSTNDNGAVTKIIIGRN